MERFFQVNVCIVHFNNIFHLDRSIFYDTNIIFPFY